MRALLAAVALLLWTAHPIGGEKLRPDGGERYATELAVAAVEIPVRVLVDGKPVRGLTAESFEVRDRGELQLIVSFEEHDLTEWETGEVEAIDGARAAGTARPLTPRGRRMLVLFDFNFSRRQYLVRALQGVREMVARQLHPADRVAVATYGAAPGVELLTGFTADAERIALALSLVEAILDADAEAQRVCRAELTRLAGIGAEDNARVRRLKLLAETVGPTAALALQSVPRGWAVTSGSGSVALTGAGDFQGRSPAAGMSRAAFDNPVSGRLVPSEPREVTDSLATGAAVSAVRSLALTLGELATLLRDLDGQKQLVYLSEGFGDGSLRDARALDFLQDMLEIFRRTGWTIQAIDLQGVPGIDEPGFAAESLFFMARETGGELFENHNVIAEATGRLIERTSVTYMLTIQPPGLLWDGSYHELDVDLVGGPGGARLIHRPGYHAPRPRAERSALEQRIDAADLLLTEAELTEIDCAVMLVPFTARVSPARVPVVVEIAGRDLLERHSGKQLRLELQAYALDDDDDVRDFFLKSVALDLKKNRKKLRQGGVRFVSGLELPDGAYRLRILVRDLDTGRLYLDTLAATVDSRIRSPLSLSPPLFVDDSERWLLVTDGRKEADRRRLLEPFVFGDTTLIPALRPAFETDGIAGILLTGTSLTTPGVRLDARIVTSSGRAVEGGRIDLWQRLAGAGAELDRVLGVFRPEGLAPGDYLLEITAADAESNRQATSSSPFTIEG